MNIQKFFLAALTAALAAPVLALSTDRDQAIEVHADRFDGDEVKQTAVYTGNVIVDQVQCKSPRPARSAHYA